MQQARWILLILIVLAGAGCRQPEEPDNKSPDNNSPGWELKPPAPNAAPISAKKKMDGNYPAGSRIPDDTPFGGFGTCDNFPKDLGEKEWGAKGTISIVAFPDEPVAYFKNRGIALRVINRTDDTAAFGACDSCLFIVCEAVDGNGRWQEIESLPGSACGNSFHRVFLKQDQYWEFPARLYAGPIKTRIRYRLDLAEGGPSIYSEEFEGEVAAAQFEG